MFLIFVCQSKKKFNVNSQIKKIKKPNFSLRKGVGKIGKNDITNLMLWEAQSSILSSFKNCSYPQL